MKAYVVHSSKLWELLTDNFHNTCRNYCAYAPTKSTIRAVGYVTHFSVMIPTAWESSTEFPPIGHLTNSSGAGRMDGSTGVQLRICTVDPSRSRVITRCIGVLVEQRWHNTNTQLFSSRCLARSCHTHTNLLAAYRCRRVSRYGDCHHY